MSSMMPNVIHIFRESQRQPKGDLPIDLILDPADLES